MGKHGLPYDAAVVDLPWYLRAQDTTSVEFVNFLNAMNRAFQAVIADPLNESLWLKFMETFEYRRSMCWLGESRPDGSNQGEGGLGYAIRYSLESYFPAVDTPADVIISHSNRAFEVHGIDAAAQAKLSKACTLGPEHDEVYIKGVAQRLYRFWKIENLNDLHFQEHIKSAIQEYAFRPSAGISTDVW